MALKLENLKEKIIDYDNNIEDIERWVLLRGVDKYVTIIDFMKANNIPCLWDNIQHYIKYEHRILRKSLKFITYLEECYRAIILANEEYHDSPRKLSERDFKKLLYLFLKLNNTKITTKFEIDIELLKKERNTITKYRNSIAHNESILDTQCKNGNIEEILTMFIHILPQEYKDFFIFEIRSCAIFETTTIIQESWHIDYSKSEKKFIIINDPPQSSISLLLKKIKISIIKFIITQILKWR